MKTFHQWKIDQLADDKKEHGVTFIRERDWYWSAFGRYCNKFRINNVTTTKRRMK